MFSITMVIVAISRNMGLVVQGVEPGGRIHKDGRLHPHDRIVEINGASLLDVTFNK